MIVAMIPVNKITIATVMTPWTIFSFDSGARNLKTASCKPSKIKGCNIVTEIKINEYTPYPDVLRA